MHRFRRGLLAGLLVVTAAPVTSQQVADTAFAPVIGTPRYQAGRGPKVVIDAAHLNFHSADEGYAPFAKLLRLDAEPAALAHPGVVGTTWPAPTFRGRRSSDRLNGSESFTHEGLTMRSRGTIGLCIVAVVGASSVAAAQATSGWILWEKNYRVKGTIETTEWEPLDGFEALAECRATAREQLQFALAYMKSGAGTLMGPVRPDGRSATFVLTGTGEKQTVDIRYLCFPGTFDPRPARP